MRINDSGKSWDFTVCHENQWHQNQWLRKNDLFFFHSLASFFHFCLTRVTIWTQQAIPNKVFIGKTKQKKKKHFTFLSRENKDHQACLPRALADLRLFPRPILSLFPSVNRRLLHWGKTDLFPYCNLSPPFYIHKRSYLPLLL